MDIPADHIRLGDALREHGVQFQTQYASHYLTGLGGRKPHLGEGLRYDASAPGGNYHAFTIHRDDAPIFCARLNELWERSWGSDG